MTPLFPIGVLIVAWFLSAIPLPFEYQIYWPLWLALSAFWFALYAPRFMGVVIAWFLGLSLDLLLGAPLASYAFGLALSVYLAGLFRLRLRHLTWSQQILMAAAFCWITLQGAVWVRWLSGGQGNPLLSTVTACVSGLVWPLVSLSLNRIARRFSVESV